ARLSRGPATLALVNRVPILPVIVFKLDGRDRIFVEPQLEPLLEPGETLAVAVRRVTQSLVELLEKYLILDPTQWRYLKLLPRYFVQTESSSSVTD
ncbi:MAG: hypothetical protein RLN82_08330, partial [Pseudomonadales bacterium]